MSRLGDNVPSLTVITQVYPPDPAAVGQHIADVAENLAGKGWIVRVYTSNRGYDDPSERYPARESRNGVEVRRFGFSSFGKRSIAIRLIAQSLFVCQACAGFLMSRRPSVALASTSPPFAGFATAIVSAIRRVPFVWWVMDINPDQMVATGKIQASAAAAKIFDWMNRVTLTRAARAITLDRFMANTLRRKAAPADEIAVVPPWSPTDDLQTAPAAVLAFRKLHGLDGRFVVMYSGNHALCHPLTTLLDAASVLEGDPRFRFVFVGGGMGKVEVDQRIASGATNLLSLPYQPRESLAASLNAADLHVVSMGNEMVGIVHPSKIYGVIAIGKPILLLGPQQSAAGEIVRVSNLGWTAPHGDVACVQRALLAAAALTDHERELIAARAAAAHRESFDRHRPIAAVCAELQKLAEAGCR